MFCFRLPKRKEQFEMRWSFWTIAFWWSDPLGTTKLIYLLGKRRECSSASNSLFWLMHRLNHVHFTRWTPEGMQSTFSRRRALSKSMLSSTTTWVTLGHSELSVCPPFFWICCWKIWYLAFPIPAGRMYTVTPLNVFPGTKNRRAFEWVNMWMLSPNFMSYYTALAQIYVQNLTILCMKCLNHNV